MRLTSALPTDVTRFPISTKMGPKRRREIHGPDPQERTFKPSDHPLRFAVIHVEGLGSFDRLDVALQAARDVGIPVGQEEQFITSSWESQVVDKKTGSNAAKKSYKTKMKR